MITVLVYNNQTGDGALQSGALSGHALCGGKYADGGEFGKIQIRHCLDRSQGDVCMESNRSAWGKPIYVGYAFRRIGEGGHANQSQHYAGVAFDVAQNLDNAQRDQLRNLAESLGVWGYVEPAYLTPTCPL